MAMGKHYGAFAKGFSDSLIAMMRLSMTKELYDARAQYYRERGYAYEHPGGKRGDEAALQGVIDQGRRDFGGGAGAGGGGGTPAADYKGGGLNVQGAQLVAKEMTDRGVKPEVAAGAVAGLMGESGPGLHTGAFNTKDPGGGSGGIGQWNRDRLVGNNGMLAFAAKNGVQGIDVNNPRDANKVPLDVQAKYVGHELDTSYKGVLKGLQSSNTGEEGLHTWVNNYEDPADKAGAIAQRSQYIAPVAKILTSQPTAPTKGPNAGKTPVASAATPYQVAGDAGAVTEAGAERAQADLEAHRAAPDQPAGRTGGAEVNAPLSGGTYDPRTIDATKTSDVPDAAGNLAPLYGPAPRADTGARPDLVARSPGPPEARNMPVPPVTTPGAPVAPSAPVANVPTANAQPVSATRAIPPAPVQDPRFTQVTAPNAGPNARNQPQMTALDLSHLWGPNPPVADRAPAPPGPPQPPPQAPPPVAVRPQDQDFAAGAPNMDDAALGVQLGAAKGGPITQRVSLAKGGAIPARPTMKLAAGGASAAYPSYTPATPVTTGLQGNTLAADQYMTGLPGMTAVDLTNPAKGYYNSYGPGQGGAGGQALTTDWSRMTPAQQQQYQQMVAGTWTPPAAPAATPAAAAPAPAPVVNPPSVQNITNYAGTPSDPSGVNAIDPTSTTTTGTPGVPTTGLQAATYDPNKIATTGTGSATNSTGGTDYSTDPNDTTKQILSAKGGAIPPLPTTRFAGAGAVSPNPVIAAMYAGTYNGPSSGGNWTGSTPYSALAPNQQAWADQQKGVWSQINAGGAQDAAAWGAGSRSPTGPVDTSQYLSQLSLMPNAIWPTAAPTAPTPLNEPGPSAQNITAPQTDVTTIDPTSTTTTGTPGVPTTGLQAATYDPNKIATTGTGSATDATGSTNYSTDPKDQTTQILSRKGGPITQRVSRYDDGGGVSPSIAGAPPGATGGGGAIPPIYYNPATYAAAGAPVGKGVSATSAPTFGAGAIPSLPMAQGGSVAFDDGGAAGGDDLNAMQSMDMQDMRDDAATAPPAASATPTSDKDPGWYINPQDTASAAPTAPTTPGGPISHDTPPPDPTTPQIKDDQGNPSKGLIGAISDGLHWLGDHLGLAGSAQAGTLPPAIAHDPNTQTNRQQFVGNHPDGATYITHQNVEELNKIADPDGQLQGAYRNIAGLEAGYKWALSRGDDATAGRLAASILHYSVLTSQNLSDQAAKSLYKGDMKDAVDKLNQASDAVPDGRLVHASLNPDGTVTIQGKNLNGQVEWQKHGAAATVLEHATALGRSGKLQWDSLESQAAKYDSTFAQMQKARQGNATDAARENRQQEVWQHQQDLLDQKQAGKDKAASDAQAQEAAVLKGMAQPRVPGGTAPAAMPPVTPRVSPAIPPAPGATTASAPAAGASPSGSGETAAATPPAGADSAAPTQGAIPSGPTAPTETAQADMPSAQAQDASAAQPPTRPDEVEGYERLPPAQQNEVWKTYQAEYKDWADQRNEDRREGRMDRRENFSQEQQNRRMQYDTDAKALAAKTAEEHAARAPRPTADVNKMFAMEPDASGKITGKQPADYFKDQAGLTEQGNIDPQLRDTQYAKEFPNRNDRTNMDSALVNGFRYSHDSTAPEIADALRGFVTNAYTGTAQRVPNDGYGPRYAVVFTRPSDGSQATVVLPKTDWQNIMTMKTQRESLAARGQADTAAIANNPYRAPPPSTTPGQSVSIPGAIANWWQGNRGQAIPPGP